MSALSSRTERWVPRRSFLVVSSANQRSTRFSHERAGRGEVQDEAWVGGQPALDRRGLVGGGVVEHEVHVEVVGDLGVDRASGTSWNSIARWRACSEPMTLPGGEVQRGVEARGAVADVVVAGARRGAGQHRQDRLRCGRAPGSGSSRRRRAPPPARAGPGRARRRRGPCRRTAGPSTASRSLPVRLQPERPPDPRAPSTATSPSCAAIDRVDQCVASFGVVSSVATITASTCSSVTVRGRPGRGSSSSPSSRSSTNRLRHRRTVLSDTPSRSAISVFEPPRPRPTRSATASPSPRRSSAAAPTPPTGPARHRSTRSRRHAVTAQPSLTTRSQLTTQDTRSYGDSTDSIETTSATSARTGSHP